MAPQRQAAAVAGPPVAGGRPPRQSPPPLPSLQPPLPGPAARGQCIPCQGPLQQPPLGGEESLPLATGGAPQRPPQQRAARPQPVPRPGGLVARVQRHQRPGRIVAGGPERRRQPRVAAATPGVGDPLARCWAAPLAWRRRPVLLLGWSTLLGQPRQLLRRSSSSTLDHSPSPLVPLQGGRQQQPRTSPGSAPGPLPAPRLLALALALHPLLPTLPLVHGRR